MNRTTSLADDPWVHIEEGRNLSALLYYLQSLSPQEKEDLIRHLQVSNEEGILDIVKSAENNMYVKSYEEQLMHYEEFKLSKFLLLYVPPILFILGCTGNILSFIILMQKNMRRVSTYIILATLSITDTLVLVAGLLRLWIGELTADMRDLTSLSCKFINVLGYTVSDYSVWLIIAVTVERYIAVIYPLKASTMCTRPRAVAVIVGILLLFLAINLHFFWTTDIRLYTHEGEVIRMCYSREGYETLVVNAWPWVDAIIYSFLPFVVILLLNSLIIHRVILARRNRLQMCERSCSKSGLQADKARNRAQHESNVKLTIMLLTVSFSFLITTLPMNILLIVSAFNASAAEDLQLASKFKLVRTITELLMYSNHSMNFYLYCATGLKFRQQLCLLLCHKNFLRSARFSRCMSNKSAATETSYYDEKVRRQNTTEAVPLKQME